MNWMTLKVGDQIAEYGYGQKISSTVKTVPKQEDGKITFQSETGEGGTIDYLMTVGNSAYCSDIYLEHTESRNPKITKEDL